MKPQYLTLLLLATTGLIAADSATPAPATTPAAEAPKTTGTKVEGVSDEDFQKFKTARATADKDAKIVALKTAADDAKKKYEANKDDKAAKTSSSEARKAYNEARKAATLLINPEIKADVYDKASAYMVKESAKKKEKANKADGESAPAADAKK